MMAGVNASMSQPQHNLFRAAGIISAATSLSRILGFIRDLLIAHLFGTSVQAQAFVVAFRLPNLFRELVAEGAVTSAFVPVLTAYRSQNNPQEYWKVAQALLTRVLVILLAISALGVWLAEPIVQVVAPGFRQDPELFALTVRLCRLLFPFVLLVGVWAYFMGMLNSLRFFAVPALGPAILNIAMIVACVGFVHRVQPGILAVAYAILLGGVVQVAVQLPLAYREGFRLRWRWRHPATTQILRLFGPRVLGAAAYQANVLVHTMLASLSGVVGVGAVAALYFAHRLIHLPLALFGTASAQASLPLLTELATQKDWANFERTLINLTRGVLCLMLPASLGLTVLSKPIIAVLFQRGAFDAYSTQMTALALMGYAVGLWAYALGKIFTSAFYAQHDTWTPVRLSLETVGLNVILSLLLMGPLRTAGLALAASLANTWNILRLVQAMQRKQPLSVWAPLAYPLLKIGIASGLMSLSAWALWQALSRYWAGSLALLFTILGSAVAYAIFCWLLKVQELQWVLNRVLRRRS
jgi:putative peptidoglycan lipid II flippase